ncbi:MAG: hypothetical protein ACREQI_12010 [Candidatus Binataceae bacterium]
MKIREQTDSAGASKRRRGGFAVGKLTAAIAQNGDVTGWEISAVAVIALGFSLAYCWFILGRLSTICLIGDNDSAFELYWAAYYTVTHFHQLPLWNPYQCGGVPLLGDPGSRILTPAFLLQLLAGPTVGIHLEIIARLALGWAGSYALARVLGINRLGAAAAGTAFGASSWYFCHLGSGHYGYMTYMYVPWVALLLFESIERRRMVLAAAGGLILALMVFEGGTYTVPHSVLLLGMLVAALAIVRRSPRPIFAVVVMGAFALGFVAVKLLPAMGSVGRLVPPFERNSPAAFIVEFFRRDQFDGRGVPGGFWGFQEYGAYIGPFIAALLIAGVVMRWREGLPWIVSGLVLLVIAAGNYGAYSPWVLLHKFQPYAGMHAPTRILIIFTMVAGILAGFGADALCTKWKGWGAAVAVLLILAAAVDGWLVNSPNFPLLYLGRPPALMPSRNFRQVWKVPEGTGVGLMYVTAVANMGALDCYSGADSQQPAPTGYNQAGYRGEQYLVGRGAVRLGKWTPNALSYGLDVPEPTILVVNQNYNRGWAVVRGEGNVISRDGLLAVRIPAGKQRLELEYRSRPFLHGLTISLATLAVMLALWYYEDRRKSAPPHSA